MVGAAFNAAAQDVKPEIVIPKMGHSIYIKGMSDNGKWGVIEKDATTDGSIDPEGTSIINMETCEITDISGPEVASGLTLNGIEDISDDGTIAVGSYNLKPAYWKKGEGWKTLPSTLGMGVGKLRAVTPDGRYGVGEENPVGNIYQSTPVMYDLQTETKIQLPGLPSVDIGGEVNNQAWATGISPDGRYVLVQMSFSYVLPPCACAYIYDRETQEYKMLGYTKNLKGEWVPEINGLSLISFPTFSHNGKWVTGFAYMNTGSEYETAFRYDVEKGELTVYDGADDHDSGGFAISNNGYLYATTPADNPYSYGIVREGNYFVTFDQIYEQVYGIDFQSMTGFVNSGKPIHVSDDELTIVMMPTPNDNYILRLKEPVSESAKRVNLLGNPEISPLPGSIMSRATKFSLTFSRKIEANGPYDHITLSSEDGEEVWTPLSSNGFTVDGNQATITFRARDLREGMKYTLTVPAGMIRMQGDNAYLSQEIKTTVIGRKQSPVAMQSVQPADNSSVAYIDIDNNPVVLTFDADIRVVENAVGKMFREGENEHFCELNLTPYNNNLIVYPTARQNLFKGTNYRLEIPAGSVTDLSGSESSANEEIVINYRGSYVREISADDRYLLSSNCNDYDAFMFYDGDRLVPQDVVAAWGFQQETTPWCIVRDADDTDMAYASHSMYKPAGKADDWFCTAQLYIPDSECYLSFQAQSYLKGKDDYLKVYVYPCTRVYNTLNKDIVEQIRTEGDLVFNKKLDPGASEEDLKGDWVNYEVDLSSYAGKDVYIAFVNDNKDQSAVFVDNIQVVHDMRFLTTFEHDRRVVNRDEAVIRGNLTIASDLETYDKALLVLKDGEGSEIDRIEENGLQLHKGDVYPFVFDNTLKLEKGTINNFTLEVTLNERTSTINSDIRNLAFLPVRRVVLEEYSGMLCSNCPLGFSAVDNILKLYPNNFIPVILRTFTSSDPLASGENLSGYTSFLGMTAAPNGRVNRGNITSPMINADGDYIFSGAGLTDSSTGKPISTWLDEVREALLQSTEADLDVSNTYDAAEGKINVTVKVRNALDVADCNLNIFTVVLENGISTVQQNGFASVTDPDLGEWGAGGRYASTYANIEMNHVVRGAYGTTFNGTPGLIPTTLASDSEYTASYTVNMPSVVSNPEKTDVVVMLINADNGQIINANRAAINSQSSGVDNIAVVSSDILISATAGNVFVKADGAINVTVFDITGRALASAGGNSDVLVNLNGYTGMAIVKAVGQNGASKTVKLIIR